jgi:hypothetical protein
MQTPKICARLMPRTVSLWRGHYAREGLAGLNWRRRCCAPAVVREEAALEAELREILGLFGERLLPRLDDPAFSLSYANGRREEIARALALRPRLLLLDEPTAGMNETETAEMMELISGLKARGQTILLIADLPGIGLHQRQDHIRASIATHDQSVLSHRANRTGPFKLVSFEPERRLVVASSETRITGTRRARMSTNRPRCSSTALSRAKWNFVGCPRSSQRACGALAYRNRPATMTTRQISVGPSSA